MIESLSKKNKKKKDIYLKLTNTSAFWRHKTWTVFVFFLVCMAVNGIRSIFFWKIYYISCCMNLCLIRNAPVLWTLLLCVSLPYLYFSDKRDLFVYVFAETMQHLKKVSDYLSFFFLLNVLKHYASRILAFSYAYLSKDWIYFSGLIIKICFNCHRSSVFVSIIKKLKIKYKVIRFQSALF